MTRFFFYAFIIFALATLSWGCGGDDEGTAPAGTETSRAAGTESVFSDSTGNEEEMIASVNDVVITRGDVNRKIEETIAQFKMRNPGITQEQIDQMQPVLWKESVQNLINQQILLQEAAREGIIPDKQAEEEQFNQATQYFSSPQELRDRLASMGITEEEFRKGIRENIMMDMLFEKKVVTDQQVSDEDIETFYRENPDEFRKPEEIRASHILIAVQPTATPAEKEEKRQKLIQIQKEITGGADFAEMAKMHSEGPSNSKGGDLGYFGRGKMVPPFEEAVFNLKVDEMSDIVETRFGYHLIKKTGYAEARIVPLEEVRKNIITFLKNKKRDEAIMNYISSARNAATIVYAEGHEPGEPPLPEQTGASQ